jgi:hypothetical protein
MRAKRLILVLTLFAATLTVRANDTPLLIELERRSGALAYEVNAAGTIVVGTFEDGSGGFYWMPTTGVVFIGGDLVSAVSRDGRTIVGGPVTRAASSKPGSGFAERNGVFSAGSRPAQYRVMASSAQALTSALMDGSSSVTRLPGRRRPPAASRARSGGKNRPA